MTDITSNSIICNTGFETPVSQTVVKVPAGAQFTAEFHHTSAGYVGPDPSDPLDPTDKGMLHAQRVKSSVNDRPLTSIGPILAYMWVTCITIVLHLPLRIILQGSHPICNTN